MMIHSKWRLIFAGVCLAIGSTAFAATEEPGRRLNQGDQFPSYKLSTSTETVIDSSESEDNATVLVYFVARQRGSEQAILDAQKLFDSLKDHPVRLIFVTANVEQKAYLVQFWADKSISHPLAFDPERKLYAQLGLIAFPSTMIVNAKGLLAHTISTHSPNYTHILEGYIHHTLGLIDEKGLNEHLKARSVPKTTPKGLASRHRAVARMMKGKGLLTAAKDELLEALKHDAENVDVRLDLANLYLLMDRIDEAATLVEQILASDERHRHAMLIKGILKFKQGNLVEAETVLVETLILNPDPARTHFYLGQVYEAMGNKDKALDHYRNALERYSQEPMD